MGSPSTATVAIPPTKCSNSPLNRRRPSRGRRVFTFTRLPHAAAKSFSRANIRSSPGDDTSKRYPLSMISEASRLVSTSLETWASRSTGILPSAAALSRVTLSTDCPRSRIVWTSISSNPCSTTTGSMQFLSSLGMSRYTTVVLPVLPTAIACELRSVGIQQKKNGHSSAFPASTHRVFRPGGNRPNPEYLKSILLTPAYRPARATHRLLTDRPLLLAPARPSHSPLPNGAFTTTFPFASSTSISFLFLYFSLLASLLTSLTWLFYFLHRIAQNTRMAQLPVRDARKRIGSPFSLILTVRRRKVNEIPAIGNRVQASGSLKPPIKSATRGKPWRIAYRAIPSAISPAAAGFR